MKAFLTLGLLSLTVLAEEMKQIKATDNSNAEQKKPEEAHPEIKEDKKAGSAQENLKQGESLPDQ